MKTLCPKCNKRKRVKCRVYCAPCAKEYNREWYKNNMGKVAASAARWAKENREHYLDYQREYYKSTLKKVRKMARADGFCGYCRKRRARKGRVACTKCALAFREASALSYQKKRAQGVCLNCSNKAGRTSLCEECQVKHRAREQIRRGIGPCPTCGHLSAEFFKKGSPDKREKK